MVGCDSKPQQCWLLPLQECEYLVLQIFLPCWREVWRRPWHCTAAVGRVLINTSQLAPNTRLTRHHSTGEKTPVGRDDSTELLQNCGGQVRDGPGITLWHGGKHAEPSCAPAQQRESGQSNLLLARTWHAKILLKNDCLCSMLPVSSRAGLQNLRISLDGRQTDSQNTKTIKVTGRHSHVKQARHKFQKNKALEFTSKTFQIWRWESFEMTARQWAGREGCETVSPHYTTLLPRLWRGGCVTYKCWQC